MKSDKCFCCEKNTASGNYANPTCSSCAKKMKTRIVICEVKDGETGNNPLRTGRRWLMKQELAETIWPETDFNKERFVFVQVSICKKLGL